MLEPESKKLILTFKISEKEQSNLNQINKTLDYSCLSLTMRYLTDNIILFFDMSKIKEKFKSKRNINKNKIYHKKLTIKLFDRQINDLLSLKDFLKTEDESEVIRFLINNNSLVEYQQH